MLGTIIFQGPQHAHPEPHRKVSPASGFGLVETMVVMCILIMLVGLALPRLNGYLDNRRLQAATTTFYNDLRFGEAEALRRNVPVYYSITTGSNWCYSLSTSTGCSCASAQACQLAQQSYASFRNVVLQSASTGSGAFVPTTSLAAPTTALFATTSGTQASVLLGLTGSVSLCAPAGALAFSEYPSC